MSKAKPQKKGKGGTKGDKQSKPLVIKEEPVRQEAEEAEVMFDDLEEVEEEEHVTTIRDILDAPRDLPSPRPLTATAIERLQDDLGKIRLNWPDYRMEEMEIDTGGVPLPDSYRSNTEKENVLLIYAENFRRQFVAKHPHRRPLFLSADNICGVRKMVCTTVKSTNLPKLILKKWRTCSKIVADLIVYEPLEIDRKVGEGLDGKETTSQLILPHRLLDPYTVVARLKGNAFDMANLLCSLLLGAQYDAYIVCGHATQDVTTRTLTRTESPYPERDDEDEVPVEEAKERWYHLTPPRDLRSKFQVAMKKREYDEAEAAREAVAAKLRNKLLEAEQAPYDPYSAYRVHAWVMIVGDPDDDEIDLCAVNQKDKGKGKAKGKGEEETDAPPNVFFIEPSTGTFCDQTNATTVYTSIESVWNDQNYWVNMQENVPLEKITFDLIDRLKWDHLFLGEPIEWRRNDYQEKDSLQFSDELEEQAEELTMMDEKHLDVPAVKWCLPVVIDYKLLDMKFPGCRRTTRYRRTIVEEYAPYIYDDGLIARIERYSDFECTPPHLYAIEERYDNRTDLLYKIVRDTNRNEITEYFRRGREDQAKKHRYHRDYDSEPERPRLIEFYVDHRYDSMLRFELTDLTMTEEYGTREDRMHYRKTDYCERGKPPPGYVESNRRIITRIVEKFRRDKSVVAGRDVARREFDLMKDIIHLEFHYDGDSITTTGRTFIKPPVSEMGEDLCFDPNRTYTHPAEIIGEKPSNLYLFSLLVKLLNDEVTAAYQIHEAEDIVVEFVRLRTLERASPELTVSFFNRTHNKELVDIMKKQEFEVLKKKRFEEDEEVDYLAPCVAMVGQDPTSSNQLSVVDAITVRSAFLEFVADLLVKRANIIQVTYEKAVQAQVAKHKAYMAALGTLTFQQEESYFRQLRETMFHLRTLERRLYRHREISNARFQQWVEFVDNDPRMQSLRRSLSYMEPPASLGMMPTGSVLDYLGADITERTPSHVGEGGGRNSVAKNGNGSNATVTSANKPGGSRISKNSK